MLEKMGWSKGKGLGANEDGSPDFIRVQYKNDNVGIGYEDRDDGWTKHETDFEELLKSLHNSKENSDVEEEENNTIGFGFEQPKKFINKLKEENLGKLSGESLEEKSKKSKARVHYKKFTRGKDLSQYSEKDLANIFGRKEVTKLVQENGEKIIGVDKIKESNCEICPNYGVTTINSGTSVQDYFKKKMSLLNGRNGVKQSDLSSTNNQENYNDINHKKKLKRKENEKEVKTGESNEKYVEGREFPADNENLLSKKEKKNKRTPDDTDVVKGINSSDKKTLTYINTEELAMNKIESIKKSKRKKSQNFEKNEVNELNEPENENKYDENINIAENNVEKIFIGEENLDVDENVENSVETNNKQGYKKKKRKSNSEDVSLKHKNIHNSENINSEKNISPSFESIEKYHTEENTNKNKRKKQKYEIKEYNREIPNSEENEEKSFNNLENINCPEEFKEDFIEEDNGKNSKKRKRKRNASFEEERNDESYNIVEYKKNCDEDDNVKKSKRKLNKIESSIAEEMHIRKEDNLEEINISIKCDENNSSTNNSDINANSSGFNITNSNNTKKLKPNKITKVEDIEKNDMKSDQIVENQNEADNLTKLKKKKRSIENKIEQEITADRSGKNENAAVMEPSESKDKLKKEKENDTTSLQDNTDMMYNITAFSAEKFRHTDIKGFQGSNLGEIIGYGLNEKMSIQVTYSDKDKENIANMWSNVINKYKQLEEEEEGNKKPVTINFKRYKKKKTFVKI